MIVGFSKYGQGAGTGAIDYLTQGKGREIAPTVLSGDPELVQGRIDQNPNEWKYTSGVLSFAPEDVVTEDQERDLMEAFEETAFAGIDPENRPEGLWIRHEHAGHHEMHYLYPRQLNDGRAYNMRPPGDQGRWDTFRDVFNHTHGWADPDDPRRSRTLNLPDHVLKSGKKNDPREIVHDWTVERITSGAIDNRDQLIEQLQEQGFNVPRIGKTYITIETDDERLRLKGEIFSQSFVSRQSIGSALDRRDADYQRSLSGKLATAQRKLAEDIGRRAEQNQKRYGGTERVVEASVAAQLVADRVLRSGDLDRLLGWDMGMDGIPDRAGAKREPNLKSGTIPTREGAKVSEGSDHCADERRWDLDRDDGEHCDVRRDGRGVYGSGEEIGHGTTNAAGERVDAIREKTDRVVGRREQAIDSFIRGSTADDKGLTGTGERLAAACGDFIKTAQEAVKTVHEKVQEKLHQGLELVRGQSRSRDRDMDFGI